ncbi:dnaJ-like protein 60 [Galendromus occidentalis]|uniref:DnaJ-like protein 60 n=1 Tax=Galendromus occidentalis TaxID=34638 RepID=A0AAJ6VVP9_9ACAR|nr:dnaJ-like protein 60 [Galendromus occidentalis]
MALPCSAMQVARLLVAESHKMLGVPSRGYSTGRRETNHYKTLGVKKESSKKEIREAYVRLSKKFHPDLGGSAEKFASLNRAYQVLSDESSRESYDSGYGDAARRSEWTTPGAKSRNFYDIYGNPGAAPRAGASESENYYGIRGVRRISNMTIVCACLVVIVVSGVSYTIGVTALSKIRDEKFKKLTAIRLRQEAVARKKYENIERTHALQLFRDEVESQEIPDFSGTSVKVI